MPRDQVTNGFNEIRSAADQLAGGSMKDLLMYFEKKLVRWYWFMERIQMWYTNEQRLWGWEWQIEF